MPEFDQATAVALLDGAGGDGPPADRAGAIYSAHLSPVWTIAGKPNGGYLLALLAKAAGDALSREGRQHRTPLSASASYVRAPATGPATVQTEVVRVGRSASQVRATLVQEDQVQVDASFVLGQLDPGAHVRWDDLPPVPLPPRDECQRVEPVGSLGFPLAVMDPVDLRLDPGVTGFARGTPSGTAELRGWVSFANGRPPDPISLLYFADALPPATFEVGSSGWVPTLQLTVYVRAQPAPGPLRVRQRSHLIAGNLCDEACDIWDSDDRLVAQAVQLAKVRFPEHREPGPR